MLVPPVTCKNARRKPFASGFILSRLKGVSFIGILRPTTRPLLQKRRTTDGHRLQAKAKAARVRAKEKAREV